MTPDGLQRRPAAKRAAGRRPRPALRGGPAADPAEALLTVAEGVRLAVVKHVALLFVPGRESLFEADAFVARLWPQLLAGMTRKDYLAAAEAAGRDGPRMLGELTEAGVLADLATRDGPAPVVSRIGVDLGSLRLGIDFTGGVDAAPLREMVAHLAFSGGACDRHLMVVGRPGRTGLALRGGETIWYPTEQAAPALKMALTDLALAALDGIALHVATLSHRAEALLLTGAPGAGKSTLAVALGAGGFRLDGDDVAALYADGRAMALPFPATVKAGAWDILAPYRADLARRPVHLRPDGQRVRYLGLEPGAPPARRIRTVLCLERSDAAPPGLAPLDVHEAIAVLLSGAWSADRKLAPRDFDALAACVAAARFYRMTYSTLEQAIALAQQAWQGAAAAVPAVAP